MAAINVLFVCACLLLLPLALGTPTQLFNSDISKTQNSINAIQQFEKSFHTAQELYAHEINVIYNGMQLTVSNNAVESSTQMTSLEEQNVMRKIRSLQSRGASDTAVYGDSVGMNAQLKCARPGDLLQRVRQLNGLMSDAQFLSLVSQHSSLFGLPEDQPVDRCPLPTGDWWGQRREVNLRSTCPWIETVKDNGEDTFPRYVKEAKCLCTRCITSTSNTCRKMKQKLTILRHRGCKDGVAVLEKDVVHVNVGCYCAGSGPASLFKKIVADILDKTNPAQQDKMLR